MQVYCTVLIYLSVIIKENDMDTTERTEFATTFQLHVDAIAWDLINNQTALCAIQPADIAALLDLCPEQDVWMYEPALEEDSSEVVATFRLIASDGTIFHMACRLTENSEVKEWIGPHDLILPARDLHAVRHSIAA